MAGSGEEVRNAIARGDTAALRRMAAAAGTEEGRMWMTLLARMLELNANRKGRHERRASRSVPAAGSGRRVGRRVASR